MYINNTFHYSYVASLPSLKDKIFGIKITNVIWVYCDVQCGYDLSFVFAAKTYCMYVLTCVTCDLGDNLECLPRVFCQ